MQVFKSYMLFFVLLTNLLEILAIRYDNYSLYDAYPTNDDQKNFLMALERKGHVDVILLNDPRENEITQILVHRAHLDVFNEKATLAGLKQEFLYDNVQSEFDKQLKPGPREGIDKIYERIQSYADIQKWLHDMAASNSDIARIELIGKSAEERNIIAFSVKQPSNIRYRSLKIIFECGIHGNEWLSVNLCNYMIDHLLQMRDDPKWKQYFWYFIPVLNPDGYEYSLKNDRLWKKNRRKIDDKSYGVNLNRNFDYRFGTHDIDSSPESRDYPGPSAFSEPETIALRDFLERKREDLLFYFSVHGHGEKFVIPYSDSNKHVDNYHQVMSRILTALSYKSSSTIFRNPSSIIQSTSIRNYKIGNSREVLGKLYSGDSASYVKYTYDTTYVMTVQLRDNGEYGLLMPNEQILPACREMGSNLFEMINSTRPLSILINNVASSGNINTAQPFFIIIIMIFLFLFN